MSNWDQKVVAVTGGSDGLGKAIASAFARRGATVVILARNEERLAEVADEFAALGQTVVPVIADVTVDDSVQQAVEHIVQQHGQIDVWVNNVGKSTRASVMECSMELYQQLLELNFYSAVRCTSAALPELKKSSGSLVTIGSLASKTGWPLMAPYATSKHALAAYAHQLRLEGPKNVNFLHVCPGPIRRDDEGTRYNQEAADLSESAKQPGAGAKINGIDPAELAHQIVRSCEQRKLELVIPVASRLLFSMTQLAPGFGDWLLKRFAPKSGA